MLRSVAFALSACLLLETPSQRAWAHTADELLATESVGASLVLDTKAYNEVSLDNLSLSPAHEEEINSSDLIMVNVDEVMGVRKEADAESEIVGYIYKDCGGIVLERGEEWSLIRSGSLEGYAENKTLLFDEEALEMAKSVGTTTAVGTGEVAYVRSEPNSKSSSYGFLSKNALVEVIEEVDDDWICIGYGKYDGYVQKKFVNVTYNIDHGETLDEMEARKKAEAEYRLKLISQREAIASDEDTEKLLAALIQCEAGGESYEGMLAVGAVVMNRVRSQAYPETVFDVIFATGQFTPVKSGFLSRVYNEGPREICYQAAREALNGYTNVGDMTHFRRKGNKEGYIIGNHVFY